MFSIATCCLTSVAVSYGMGRHIDFISPQQASKVLFYTAILQPVGITAFCLPKLSIVIFIRRLAGPQMRGLYFLYSIIVILFISSALCFIMVFAQCDPPSHFWHPTDSGKCLSPLVLQDITIFAGGKSHRSRANFRL